MNIVHKSGKSNSNADALSRIPYHSEEDHGGQIPNQQVCSEVGLQSSAVISNQSVSHASPENKFGVIESSDSAVSLHQPASVSNSETEISEIFSYFPIPENDPSAGKSYDSANGSSQSVIQPDTCKVFCSG